MEDVKLFDAEFRFMAIVWEHTPIKSTELVKLANSELGWKKSTTYTVLRRLEERGALKNENAVVKALVPKEQVQRAESAEFLDKIYDGSLKMFLVSFLEGKAISEKDAEELKNIIDGKTFKGV